MGANPYWCTEYNPEYCPFPERVLYDKVSWKPVFSIVSYQNNSSPFGHLEDFKGEGDDISTFSEYVALFGIVKMMVKFTDLPTLAFPLEEYPSYSNGSFNENQISFFKTFQDQDGGDYWSSAHEIGMVNLPRYAEYVDRLRKGEVEQKEYIPRKADYVYFDPETLDLQFDPFDPPKSVLDGSFEKNRDVSGLSKASVEGYCQLLIQKVHFLLVEYSGKPIWTLDKLLRNTDKSFVQPSVTKAPECESGNCAVVTL